MKVQMFAVLKNYFTPELTIESAGITNVSDLVNWLTTINPDADKVLNNCRVAVDMEFVSREYKLKEDDVISFVPPSSGG